MRCDEHPWKSTAYWKISGQQVKANMGDFWKMNHSKSQYLWFFSQKPALAVHALCQGIISYSFAEWVQ